MKIRSCELCKGDASIFCPSDSAFLCWRCDAKVHSANFLVARHTRRTVCSRCCAFTGDRLSGVGFRTSSVLCSTCSPVDDTDTLSSSSTSSACISSSESCVKSAKKIASIRCRKKRDAVSSNSTYTFSGDRANSPGRFSGEITSETTKKFGKLSRNPLKADFEIKGIFSRWCSAMGVGGGGMTLQWASQAFNVCSTQMMALPKRVSLAASLWFSLRLCSNRSASLIQNLERLEQISGVPAKLIVAAESGLVRVLKMRQALVVRQPRTEEGWDESSAKTTA